MIETLDDIIEQLANELGIYGAHDYEACDRRMCRSCWTASIRSRINQAVEIERKINA